MAAKLELHPDRLFPSSPAERDIARELYNAVRNLPIISPHGHTDPAWFADNAPFPDPASLLIVPDHYLLRMLYSQGVKLEDLGVPRRDGGPNEHPVPGYRRCAVRGPAAPFRDETVDPDQQGTKDPDSG